MYPSREDPRTNGVTAMTGPQTEPPSMASQLADSQKALMELNGALSELEGHVNGSKPGNPEKDAHAIAGLTDLAGFNRNLIARAMQTLTDLRRGLVG